MTDEIITVDLNNLDEWLREAEPRGSLNPYKLNITNINTNRIYESDSSGSLGYILKQYSNRYVDLSATQLPLDEKYPGYLRRAFKDCTNLVAAPILPDGIYGLPETFRGCTNLLYAPTIPEGVEDLDNTFAFCYNLLVAPHIPASVHILKQTFYGCGNLIIVPNIPLALVDGYEMQTDLTGTFNNCSALKYIYDFYIDPANYQNFFYRDIDIPHETTVYVPVENYDAYRSFSGKDYPNFQLIQPRVEISGPSEIMGVGTFTSDTPNVEWSCLGPATIENGTLTGTEQGGRVIVLASYETKNTGYKEVYVSLPQIEITGPDSAVTIFDKVVLTTNVSDVTWTTLNHLVKINDKGEVTFNSVKGGTEYITASKEGYRSRQISMEIEPLSKALWLRIS